MEQRISLITLGVADLARAVAFYRKTLGWEPVPGPPGIAFFDLGGLVFSLYPDHELAEDMQAPDSKPPSGYPGFALAVNVRSEAEVDSIFASLAAHGAMIVKSPRKASWGGYSGYFADPDGHRFEVAFNPYWTVGPDGRIELVPPKPPKPAKPANPPRPPRRRA